MSSCKSSYYAIYIFQSPLIFDLGFSDGTSYTLRYYICVENVEEVTDVYPGLGESGW